MSEPTTEAGKRLLNDVREVVVHGVTDRIKGQYGLVWQVREDVVAIEQEALANADRELREARDLVDRFVEVSRNSDLGTFSAIRTEAIRWLGRKS